MLHGYDLDLVAELDTILAGPTSAGVGLPSGIPAFAFSRFDNLFGEVQGATGVAVRQKAAGTAVDAVPRFSNAIRTVRRASRLQLPMEFDAECLIASGHEPGLTHRTGGVRLVPQADVVLKAIEREGVSV